MPPTRRKNDGLLARVNFPLYAIQMLTSRHVIVAGGGGSSKTGVANGLEIYEITHNGVNFQVEEVIRHETGRSVIMNCASQIDRNHTYLAVGQESHCQLYHIKSVLEDIEIIGNSNKQPKQGKRSVRRRKSSTREENFENDSKSAEPDIDETPDTDEEMKKKIRFIIKPSDSIQTDFNKDEPYQRVVRISTSGKLMVTGGTDGHVRIWAFPSLKLRKDINAHSKELDDIDFDTNGTKIITIAKDGNGIIWDTNTGKKILNLSWPQPEGTKYLYKRCRFGINEHDNSIDNLFTLSNPTGCAGKQKAYLQLWHSNDGKLLKSFPVDESLSALAVRDDGRFVAIGTMFSGSVSVHVAFSLQRVLHVPGAHSMFVTGLEFLPVVLDEHTITTVSEAAVLSISVDNRVCIHSLPYRKTMPVWAGVLLIIITLFLTFLFCAYIGL